MRRLVAAFQSADKSAHSIGPAPAGFNKIEQVVPMRDGVKLHTIIYAPKSHRDPLPIVFNRTLPVYDRNPQRFVPNIFFA